MIMVLPVYTCARAMTRVKKGPQKVPICPSRSYHSMIDDDTYTCARAMPRAKKVSKRFQLERRRQGFAPLGVITQ